MKVVAKNRDVGRSFVVRQTIEAGIVLTGPEVKSAKRGQVSLAGAWASVRDGSLALVNCHIAPYAPAAAVQADYNPRRERRLLVGRKTITSLVGQLSGTGLTLVPLSVYIKQGLIKVALGLARGMEKEDRRERIKRRAIDRDIQRAIRRKP